MIEKASQTAGKQFTDEGNLQALYASWDVQQEHFHLPQNLKKKKTIIRLLRTRN